MAKWKIWGFQEGYKMLETQAWWTRTNGRYNISKIFEIQKWNTLFGFPVFKIWIIFPNKEKFLKIFHQFDAHKNDKQYLRY